MARNMVQFQEGISFNEFLSSYGAEAQCFDALYRRRSLGMERTVVEGFRTAEITAWARQHLSAGTRVASDGLTCIHGVTAAGCVHDKVVAGIGACGGD